MESEGGKQRRRGEGKEGKKEGERRMIIEVNEEEDDDDRKGNYNRPRTNGRDEEDGCRLKQKGK